MPRHMLNMELLLQNMPAVPQLMMSMDTRPTQDISIMPYIIMATQSITDSTDIMAMHMDTMLFTILLAMLNMLSMTLAKPALMLTQLLMDQKDRNGKLLLMLKMEVTGKRLLTLIARFKIMKISPKLINGLISQHRSMVKSQQATMQLLITLMLRLARSMPPVLQHPPSLAARMIFTLLTMDTMDTTTFTHISTMLITATKFTLL